MDIVAMADINVDVSKLPEDVREKLAELDLELSEGKRKELGIICVMCIWLFLVIT